MRRYLDGCCLSVPREFSFKNKIVKATFDFTLFVLELLGRINAVFQERLSTASQLWDIIVSLKAIIEQLATQTSLRVFPVLKV